MQENLESGQLVASLWYFYNLINSIRWTVWSLSKNHFNGLLTTGVVIVCFTTIKVRDRIVFLFNWWLTQFWWGIYTISFQLGDGQNCPPSLRIHENSSLTLSLASIVGCSVLLTSWQSWSSATVGENVFWCSVNPELVWPLVPPILVFRASIPQP